MPEFPPMEGTGVHAWARQAWRGLLPIFVGVVFVAVYMIQIRGGMTRQMFTCALVVGFALWASVELFRASYSVINARMRRRRTPSDLVKLTIDAAIVIVAGGLLFWHVMVRPALVQGLEVTTLLGYVVASTLCVVAARYQRGRAARVSEYDAADEQRLTSASLIPYIAVVAGYALLFFVAKAQQVASLTTIVVAVFVLTAFVLLRQFITVRENAQLLADRILQEAQFRKELTHQAYHDPLTGLANRAWFGNQVDAALARGEPTVSQLAVFFLDLDNFKNINDSLGHGVGDALLTEVAGRLLNATRGSDTVARLGGDEFAVLVGRVTSEKDIAIIGDRIVNAIKAPFELDGREVYTSTSIGIARTALGQGTEEILRNADVAMYVSKRQGKGVYTIFEPTMHAEASIRLGTEIEIRQGLARGEFSLLFQPIVDIADQKTVGVEALTRWNHPTRGELLPADFIPLAEECGLILPLGRWILTEACTQGARWRAMLPDDALFTIAVNISRRQLEQATFVDEVATVLADTGLNPRYLLLEITESVIIRDTEMMLHRLCDLKALGVRLAIDDFGTGYSSLGFLQQFPIDVLKIDKSFVNGLATKTPDAGAVALTQTIVSLGHTLAMETVAEGVEEGSQADALTAMGCAVAQGFHFSKPVVPDAIDSLIRDGSAGGAPHGRAA